LVKEWPKVSELELGSPCLVAYDFTERVIVSVRADEGIVEEDYLPKNEIKVHLSKERYTHVDTVTNDYMDETGALEQEREGDDEGFPYVSDLGLYIR